MDRVAICTYVSYHWLTLEIRAQVEAITINWEAELDLLPSATMKHQEEEENTLSLEIGGQLGEVKSIPAKTKQEDVPKEEEEKAQVAFEVSNKESPLTKSDFNDYFVIDIVDEILQKNTYEDPFEIDLIQAKDSIKEYINCLNTSSSLKSKGALREELGRHIC
ncbi:hypothetical protein SLEP1_g47539 [Rubroshorea leprosula]|uniref:Uncharacterized protein n=1 Tax=Rubroshorea leprosula TaxID=152421 RepID=A0AAV5LRM2_9ROSI|nr:hypothetical protein SLEP1_g47539 [Rubroshorea leprosula]